MRTRVPRRQVADRRGPRASWSSSSSRPRLVTSDDGCRRDRPRGARPGLAAAARLARRRRRGPAQILRHLAGAADAWDALGRPDSELYRGARLARALEWRARAAPDLTDVDEPSSTPVSGCPSPSSARPRSGPVGSARSTDGCAGCWPPVPCCWRRPWWPGLGARSRQADRAARSADAADARRLGARALASEDLAESLLLGVEGVRVDDSPQTRANLFEVISRRPQLLRSAMVGGAQHRPTSTSARTAEAWSSTTCSAT